MIKKIFKTFLFIILFAIGALLLFVLVSVLPIDRYDYHESPFYHTMNDRLDSLKKVKSITKGSTFSIGYSKVNLTPDHRISLAGYGNRKGALYSSVHDSIYVRTMVISNKNTRVAIVSADLLIIPPTVTAVLEKELPSIGFTLSNTYLNAIHTHNSIGNWGKGVVGFMYGSYDDSIVHFIADKIKASILLASKNALPSTIKTAHIPVKGPVRNRIKDDGGVDSILHVVEVHREDSSKLIVMSYTAHATCLYSRDWELSRDYPGVLVDTLEKRGYAFAMFMAGAVGSHGPTQSGWAGTEWMSNAIVSKFEKQKSTLTSLKDSSLVMCRIPLELGKAQVKISEDWKVRPWLFRAAFGYSPNYLTVLRIGELVLIGAPCDYSGELTPELYAAAQKKNLQVMVTSFNGGYIGYITPLKYYDVDHYETRLMNWYGPGSGEYMQGCLLGLLDVVSN
jgi:neutral ceramidase